MQFVVIFGTSPSVLDETIQLVINPMVHIRFMSIVERTYFPIDIKQETHSNICI